MELSCRFSARNSSSGIAVEVSLEAVVSRQNVPTREKSYDLKQEGKRGVNQRRTDNTLPRPWLLPRGVVAQYRGRRAHGEYRWSQPSYVTAMATTTTTARY